ncbi:MAG TPA: hypothetical protein VL362_02900 [Patescibacteria group bacterium]|jgi:hypothetical protein|nr:hypothetical protein [Patescibacteria group bacterium]
MDKHTIDAIALEQAAKDKFGFIVDVDTVIVDEADIARSVKATVYLTKKKQLLCYMHGATKLTLGDVRKLATRMGFKIELCLPPKGRPKYFDELAEEQFRAVFPGRRPASDEDLAYYRTLAPYNPALILIAEVRDGTIYQFDPDARTSWRPAAKFAYRRIKTS